jgi:hypothetical protein
LGLRVRVRARVRRTMPAVLAGHTPRLEQRHLGLGSWLGFGLAFGLGLGLG